MRLLVGDDTGLLKGIEVSEVSTIDEEGGSTKSASITHRWGRQGREERVARMCWAGGSAARSEEFAVAHVGGRVELRNTDTTESVMSWHAPIADGAADVVRGLAVSGSAEHDWRLVSCTESGIVRTWRRGDNSQSESGGCDAEWPTCGLSGKQAGDANHQVLGDSKMVSRMRVDRVSCSRLVLGGREKELAVWDVATQKVLWTAKNVKHDNLSLRVPVWNVDMDFRSGTENELLALTAEREIRHYDMREGQRRPVYSIPIDGTKMDVGDCRFNAMALYGDFLAICGDVVGGLSMFDLRKRHSVGAMAGGGGSVRDISVDEDRGMICCGGADRYVRVYSIKSLKKLQLADQAAGSSAVRSGVGKKMLHKLYLKQRTNAILIVPPAAPNGSTSALSAASSKTTASSASNSNDTETKKITKRKAKAEARAGVAIDQDVVDPLAAMDAAFDPSSQMAGSEEDDGSESDEDEYSEDGDSDDGTDDDDDDDDSEDDGDDDLDQDEAAKTETVAAEENDDDFMQWVLGGAAASEELDNVVPAGELCLAAPH
jgi:WD40 repeat protein